MFRVSLLSLLICAAAGNPAAAQDQPESSLSLEPWHARLRASGNTGAAATSIEFVLLNPASGFGTVGLEVTRASGSEGVTDFDVAGAFSLGSGTLVVNLRNRSWGAIAEDLGIDDLTVRETSATVGYGTSLRDSLLAGGVSVTLLSADYLGNASTAWTFDLGLVARLHDRLSVGASLLRPFATVNDMFPSPPTRLRVGAEGRVGGEVISIVPRVDISMALRRSNAVDYFAGGSLVYRNPWVTAELSSGVSRLAAYDAAAPADLSWAAGGSVTLGRLRFGYARRFTRNDLPGANTISAGLAWAQ